MAHRLSSSTQLTITLLLCSVNLQGQQGRGLATDTVAALKQPRHGGWSGRGALVGAGVGLLVGGGVGAYLDSRHLSTHGSLVPVSAISGAVLCGFAGAGGTTGLKGGVIGLLIGGGAGVLLGLASGGSGGEGAGGLAALALGPIGGGVGFVVGEVVAVSAHGGPSPEGSQNRVQVGVAPRRSGLTVRASFTW